MKQIYDPQTVIQFYQSKSKESKKFQIIDNFLEKNKQIFEEIKDDFKSQKGVATGAKGITIEQVVRIAILKQTTQLSYRKLYDALNDNICYRNFTKIYDSEVPKHNALALNVKKISKNSWEKINKVLIEFAKKENIETGKKVRIDSTAVESNIHYPTDAELLWDCIRVIDRIIETIKTEYPDLEFEFQNHTRRCKKRRFKIKNTNKKEHRNKAYKDLLKIAKATSKYTLSCIESLSNIYDIESQIYKKELENYFEALNTIIDQTELRVINGESVPAEDKLVSIFEQHTDILVKGKRKVVFGHKILLSGGASNLILDCVIKRGNWSDSEIFPVAINRLEENCGPIFEIATDGGFASKKNYEYAKEVKGIDKVVFTKKASSKIKELIKTSRAYKKLKKFRAGIEGCISAAKRAYGLDRCRWSGWEGFQRYVWASVVAFNCSIIVEKLL
jgi:IS5 family transposase